MTIVYRKINGQWFYSPVELDQFSYYRDYLLVRRFGELINANVYEQGSVEAGLFSHWKMDSFDSNTLVDDVGDGDLTLYYSDPDITVVSGYDGNAIRCDGLQVDFYGESATPYSAFTENFSISMRIQSVGTPDVNDMDVVSFQVDGGPDTSGFSYTVRGVQGEGNQNKLEMMANFKTDDLGIDISEQYVTISEDEWNLFVLAVDMTETSINQVKLYFNTSEEYSGPGSGSHTQVVYDGEYSHRPFLGLRTTPIGDRYLILDDLKFHNITLTPEQIAAL